VGKTNVYDILGKNLVVLVVSYAAEVARKYYLTDRTDTLIVRITF
jgi:hypothetical protein